MTQTEFVVQAEQAIASEGGRMTNARRAILDVIAGSHEHLTAEDIIARAQRRDRAVNASTVYRTLAFLKTHGLIKSRYFDQDNHREVFEPTPNTEHYHFTCSQCGAVIEFDSPHVASLRRQLQTEYGVDVARACLCLTGLCAKCKSK
ncbi:MAG: transcriptional repressor [Chloroflexi bacterium]|nr:transcriptional repressor [Chloroflexota bacterium]